MRKYSTRSYVPSGKAREIAEAIASELDNYLTDWMSGASNVSEDVLDIAFKLYEENYGFQETVHNVYNEAKKAYSLEELASGWGEQFAAEVIHQIRRDNPELGVVSNALAVFLGALIQHLAAENA